MDLWQLVASHHGVATVEQLVAAGISTSTLSRWEREGRIARVARRTYVFTSSPATFERSCWVGLLAAPGSALSHRTAAHLWGLTDDDPPVEIVVERGRTPCIDGVVVHQTRDPYVPHLRKGFPVTSPLRTVLDLGAVAPRAVHQAVDKGRVAGLFSISALEWQLADLARQGRRGCGALRKVLDDWALGAARPEGLLEPRFARLRARYGLPVPVFQYRVGRYRIDFAYPELMIAIEVDGYEKRATKEAFQSDLDRQNHLVALGWTVLRFTWADVVTRPAYVARTVADEIGRASSRMRESARPNS